MDEVIKNNLIQQISDEMTTEELDDFINRLIFIRDAKRLSDMGLITANNMNILSVKYVEPKTNPEAGEIEIS